MDISYWVEAGGNSSVILVKNKEYIQRCWVLGVNRDRAQLMSSFITGLKKEYRKGLLTARPEANKKKEADIVSVCSGTDDTMTMEKEERDQKKQRVMRVNPTRNRSEGSVGRGK